MQGPIDYMRGRFDNIRAHPFQNLASTVFGGFVPGGGIAANALFNRYNNSQFNNAAQQVYDRSQQQTTMDANSAMNDPLSGPLGDYDRANPNGELQAPNSGRADQNRQLGQALTGGGAGANAGGLVGGGYSPPGGWSQQTMSGWNPNQANANQAFGLLDFLGANPNQTPFDLGPTGHVGPQQRRDAAQGGYGGNPANYGVSNFMVGGSPVIFGSGDPNGRYRNRGTDFGG